MQEQELAIKFSHVSKEYRLGQIGGGTLKGDLQTLIARLRGKEDPNSIIGSGEVKVGERFLALNDISFQVRKGEALGIIGHNGAGKSTLLKLLSRVTGPSAGTISYNGRIASMLEVGTGFHPEMTGRENIYMNGAILGMTKAEINKKFDQIVEFAEMEPFIDTPVKRYSSGMYVKLAFAVAAHLDSEIMVMDEVLAVGDMKFQQKCLRRMGDAASGEGRTVLYVSHNMNTIRQLCTRCIVLDHGNILYEGNVEEAIGTYMKSSGDITKTKFDFSQITSKPNTNANQLSAKLLGLEITDNQSGIYHAGEYINFNIDVLARKKYDQLRFRFELRYADDIPVGTVPDIELGPMDSSQKKRFHMRFLTSGLTRGKYTVCLVLFERNEYGTCADQDLIFNAFQFEIKDSEAITWNTSTWGHIRLPDMIVSCDEV